MFDHGEGLFVETADKVLSNSSKKDRNGVFVPTSTDGIPDEVWESVTGED